MTGASAYSEHTVRMWHAWPQSRQSAMEKQRRGHRPDQDITSDERDYRHRTMEVNDAEARRCDRKPAAALYYEKSSSPTSWRYTTKKNVTPAVRTANFSPYWRWIAAVGLVLTLLGFVVGILLPGPASGILLPIGISILLIVAYGAKERISTARQ